MGLDLAGEMAGSGGGSSLGIASPDLRETDATAPVNDGGLAGDPSPPIPQTKPPAPVDASLPKPGKEEANPWALGLAAVADGILSATRNTPYATAMVKGMEDQRLKRQQVALDGLKITADAVEHGIKILDKIPDAQRARFVESYSAELKKLPGGVGDASAEAFLALKDQPDAAQTVQLVKDFSPATQSALLRAANNNSTQVLAILGNKEKMDAFRSLEDNTNRESIIQKFQAVQRGVAAVSPDAAKALSDGKLTLAEFQPIAKKLLQDGDFTPWEIASLRRSTDLQAELGLATPKAREAGQEAGARAGAQAQVELQTAGPIAAAKESGAQPFKMGFEAFKQDLEGKRQIAVDAAKAALRDPQAEFKNANTLRDEYNALTKDYRTVQDAYGKIVSTGKSQTAAGDMAMLYAYVKLLDPQTGVREGEFATAAAAGSFGEKVQGAALKVISGERMPDSQRQDFLDQAKKIYQVHEQTQKSVGDTYTRIAKKAGVDPADVIVDLNRTALKEGQKIQSTDLSRIPDGSKLTGSDGKKYTVQGGKPVLDPSQ